MKKKAKELTRVTMFYDAERALIIGLCFAGYFGMLIYYLVGDAPFNNRTIFSVIVMPPLLFGFLLYLLSRRVIDSKGVSSTYFGIKYRHISWQSLYQYTIEKVYGKFQGKKPENERIVLVFKAIPIEGKSTTIKIPATKEVVSLAERYFGPPSFVQEGISFDD